MTVDDTIKEIYNHRARAFENAIRLVEHRLTILTWSFALLSAVFVSNIAFITSADSSMPMAFKYIALLSALTATFGSIGIFFGRHEGLKSYENLLHLITMLDIQMGLLLNPDVEKEDLKTAVLAFLRDEYHAEKDQTEIKNREAVAARKWDEGHWIYIVSYFAIAGLLFTLSSVVGFF